MTLIVCDTERFTTGFVISFTIEACEAAGYDFRALNDGSKKHLLKGEEINAIVNDITNPVVKRSVSQTSSKYGCIFLIALSDTL